MVIVYLIMEQYKNINVVINVVLEHHTNEMTAYCWLTLKHSKGE